VSLPSSSASASASSSRRVASGLRLGVRFGFLLSLLCAAACDDEPAERPTSFGGARPVMLQVPAQLDEGREYPLVLVLHGYGANGFLQQAYFGLGDLATRGDAFVLAPEGTVDSTSRQFWNADPVCCDFGHLAPDDVGYLGGLIEDVADSWPIDPGAVFLIGHSNGAFMSYRLACERSDLFAAIVGLAGNAASVPCQPAQPVSILHVHGTADDVVPYSGAVPSVTQWAGLDGCGGARTRGADLDLEVGLAGAETKVEATSGCASGVAVDLWTMEGAGHVPTFGVTFPQVAWKWLTEHRR
jgi:polyhydroxybutyrate depolymerase